MHDKYLSYSIATGSRPTALFVKMKTQFKVHKVATSTLEPSTLGIILLGILSCNFYRISRIFFIPAGTKTLFCKVTRRVNTLQPFTNHIFLKALDPFLLL